MSDSFFDDITDDEIFNEIDDLVSTDDENQQFLANLGDVVYYDLTNFTFTLASSSDSSKMNISLITSDWKYIIIGIVVKQHEDLSVDVLMNGFLSAEPIRLPIQYYAEDKRKYIRPYIYNLYKRYVRAFFKKCPEYEDLLKLKIDMPSVSDLTNINENKETIFNSLKDLWKNETKFQIFINRFFNNFIYVRENHKIYQMEVFSDDKKPNIIYPDIFSSDFMCVFRNVKIFDFSNNKSSEDSSNIEENNDDVEDNIPDETQKTELSEQSENKTGITEDNSYESILDEMEDDYDF